VTINVQAHAAVAAAAAAAAAVAVTSPPLRSNSTVTVGKSNIVWRDLSYYVLVDGQKKQLLNKVNGYSKPGTLTALMGSSGAGKTTLMDVIAGRKTGGIIEGEILVNGQPKDSKSFNRLAGYVEQTDIHLGTATVYEALLFSCQLRNNDGLTAAEQAAWVDEVIDLLELTEIAHRVIGDVISPSLSPSQMKLVTIGVELVTNPIFLFLDEPTSGLDSRAAYVVMRVVKKISLTGRCVICTIHQPSAELFYLFDRLLLLKSGGVETVFCDIDKLVNYFETAPIAADCYRPPFTANQNPAVWMLDVIGAGTSAKGKIADYAQLYTQSSLRTLNMTELTHLAQDAADAHLLHFDSVFAASYTQQCSILAQRMFSDFYRNVDYNFARLFLMLFLGILFGLMWLQLNDNDVAGMNSKVAAIFMAIGFAGVINSDTALPVMFRLREVFYRERASNTYHHAVWSTLIGIVEIPYVFATCVCFLIPFYFLVGFENNATKFFECLLSLFLVALSFCFMGQLFSVSMGNLILANVAQGFVLTFFFLFTGTFISVSAIPKGWLWVYYINPLPKGIIAVTISQYSCLDGLSSAAACPSLYDPLTDQQVTKSDWSGSYMQADMRHVWYWYYNAWLLFTCLVLRILIFICVKYINHQKR
jgi:ABC-type multidrug transport system ATPase subunit/ABC-type multidrug transport system permease subunit